VRHQNFTTRGSRSFPRIGPVIFSLYFVIFPRFGYAAERDLSYDRSRILSIVLLKEAELAVLLSGGDAFYFSRKAILVENK